jgi:type IV pilus assembly protein PilZ
MSESRRDSEVPNTSRRAQERVEVTWDVDCRSDETFLYAYITNVSAMGLFVRTEKPLAVGTRLELSFTPEGVRPFRLLGEVAWLNSDAASPNPGMGVRFVDLHADERERLVAAIRTIAYVRGDAC